MAQDNWLPYLECHRSYHGHNNALQSVRWWTEGRTIASAQPRRFYANAHLAWF